MTNNGRAIIITVFCILFLNALPLAASSQLNVGFIYVGPIGDVGWTYSHEQSRLKLIKDYPYVKTIEVPMVDEKNAEKVMRNLIDRGINVIFATSYDHGPGIAAIAKEFPDVQFFYCAGHSKEPNVTNYFGRMYEGTYLVGATAASISKTGTIGYIGPKSIPETKRIFNAFVLGARKINPEIKIKLVWTGDWYAPTISSSMATQLIENGADVIFNGGDSAAPFQVALDNKKYAVGYYVNVTKFAPDYVAASSAWNWSVFYDEIIPKLQNKSWEKKDLWWGVKQKAVVLELSDQAVPLTVKKLIRQMEADLKSGNITVFKGPLNDYSGKQQLRDNSVATDEYLLEMDWLLIEPESYSNVRP